MKLVVGLGNPGKEYENTRHNIGFMSLDKYAIKENLDFSKNKFKGLYAEKNINNEKVIFLKPQSYMNLSGEVVASFVNFFKIPLENILIIHDDMDIELGKYKLKPKGSGGGHNGLKNIALHLKTENYYRLKIGISKDKKYDMKDYVLGHFSKEEMDKLDIVLKDSILIIDDFIKIDFDHLMNKHNHS